MADETNDWFLAIGDDSEIADYVMEPSEFAPTVTCRTCGRDSYVTLTSLEPTVLCPCGAVLLEIVARL